MIKGCTFNTNLRRESPGVGQLAAQSGVSQINRNGAKSKGAILTQRNLGCITLTVIQKYFQTN